MTIDKGQSWEFFWRYSAEHANEAIRLGKILPNGDLNLDIAVDKNPEDILFESTHRKYIDSLKLMDKEIKKNTFQKNIKLYRNVFNDIYSDININDLVQNDSFISCFMAANDNDYGDFSLEINVPKGINYLTYSEDSELEHGDVVILPPGFLTLIDRNEVGYVFEYKQSTPIFIV